MENLADKVIHANEVADTIDDGPKLDDVGLVLPDEDSEYEMCEYLTARILRVNDMIYKHNGLLWIHDKLIKENKNTYYRLAKYPKQISDPECQYVWRRLREIVPELDPDVIAILPNMTFNMRTGEVKFEKVWTITPWEEE